MRVLIKQPGEPWEVSDVRNTLEGFQEAVGGYIETYTVDPERGLVLICDEEGRLNGKEHNLTIEGIEFVGTLLLCGVDGDEFTDVPDWAVRGLRWHK